MPLLFDTRPDQTRPDKGVAKKEGCEGEGRELLITIYARFSIRDAWGILKDAVELEIKQREPHHHTETNSNSFFSLSVNRL